LDKQFAEFFQQKHLRQFFLDWQDRERVKNPLSPPSLAVLKDTAQLVTTIADQGTLTAGDINNFTRSTISAYRTTQKLAQSTAGFLGLEDIPGVKEEMFRREVAGINKYIAKYWEYSVNLIVNDKPGNTKKLNLK
jgi:hypothetical protein